MKIHSILKLLPVLKQMGTQSYFKKQYKNSQGKAMANYP